MAIPPRPYLRDEVYKQLRQHVMELASAISEPIPIREVDLARRLGVSRTPVREALNRLQQEGMVDAMPHRGFMVAPTTLEEYLCWLEIRETLEGVAARRAAAAISAEGIAYLRGLFTGIDAGAARKVTDAAYLDANAKFHAKIIEEAGAGVLTRLAKAYDYLGSARRAVRGLRLIERSLDQHMAIIDALERRDGEEAERLSREHVRDLRNAILRSLDGASGDN